MLHPRLLQGIGTSPVNNKMVSASIYYCYLCVSLQIFITPISLICLRIVIYAHITEKETETQNQLDLSKVTWLVIIVLPSSQGFCFPVTTQLSRTFLIECPLGLLFPLSLISIRRSPSCHVQIFCYQSFIMYHPCSPVIGTKNKATLSQSRKFQ